MKTPSSVILLVVGVLALVGGDLDDLGADHARDLVGQAPLAPGEGRGDAQQRDDVLCAEGPDGEREQGRGVDAAGVGDAELPHARELGGDRVGELERLALQGVGGHLLDLEAGMAGREQRGGGLRGGAEGERDGLADGGHLLCSAAPSRSEARRKRTSPAWSITRVSGSSRSASMSREAGSMYSTLYASVSSLEMEVAK